MARADTITKLPLDRWAYLMGLNPMHFNGVYVEQHLPTVCQQPWMQYAYQAVDRVGREEVAFAIAAAEANMEEYLGFHLRPAWIEDEWRATTRYYKPELTNLSSTDIRGYSATVSPLKGYLISGGVRSKSIIDAGAAVVYSDEDGDTYEETATVTVTVVAGQAPCELRVYLQAADTPDGTAADDRYEVRPIRVSITGVTATIIFTRQQVLLPAVYDDLVPPTSDSHLRGADGENDLNFVTDVDVYRVYNDPQTQAILMWEPTGGNCGCNEASCHLCAYSVQNACLTIRGEPRTGRFAFRPAAWDADTEDFASESLTVSRQPDAVRLYYYSGWKGHGACPLIEMDGIWERAVAYYAAALLERPICECSNVRDFIEKWQRVPTVREGLSGVQQFKEIDTPFGVTEGALYAWKIVKQLGKGAAVIA